MAEENDLKGVIDGADFNDEDKLGKEKEMVDRLSKLVAIFDGMYHSDTETLKKAFDPEALPGQIFY